MSVEINFNKSKWISTLKAASQKATYALAAQVKADSTKFVPLSGGSTQSEGQLRAARIDPGESGEMYVVWDEVYAQYQWFGMRRDGSHQVHHYTTPGTGTQWAEKARAAYGKNWQKIAQGGFNEGLK